MVTPSPHQRQPRSQIRQLRQRAGMSSTELANLLGVTTATIENWERNPLNRWITFIQICQIFSCKPEDIVHPQFSRNSENSPEVMTLEVIRSSFLNKNNEKKLDGNNFPPTRIREWREARNWSQQDLWEILNISKNTLQSWESDHKYLKLFNEFSKLCKIFLCKPEDLVDFVPEYQLHIDNLIE